MAGHVRGCEGRCAYRLVKLLSAPCVLEDILGPVVPGCCLDCMAMTWESCEEYYSGDRE